jgi:hypothetical protein
MRNVWIYFFLAIVVASCLPRAQQAMDADEIVPHAISTPEPSPTARAVPDPTATPKPDDASRCEHENELLREEADEWRKRYVNYECHCSCGDE